MSDPIKLSNERVREILVIATDPAGFTVKASSNYPPSRDEIAALAQAVLDLRTANSLLESICDAKEAHDAHMERKGEIGAADVERFVAESKVSP